jgi:hypothetical protein
MLLLVDGRIRILALNYGSGSEYYYFRVPSLCVFVLKLIVSQIFYAGKSIKFFVGSLCEYGDLK